MESFQSENSSSDTDGMLIVDTIDDETADALMEKHMRGEVLTDAEQAKFDLIFA